MPYRARFIPIRPALMLVFSAALVPFLVGGLFLESWREPAVIAGQAFWFLVVAWAAATAASKLRRMARSGWTALAVEPQGVRIGAGPDGSALSFPWDDVAAIVRFTERSLIYQNRLIPYVGVSLVPGRPGGVQDFRDRLAAALDDPDLSDAERDTFRRAAATIADADFPADRAVSVYLRVRDWRLNRRKLERAVAELAPDRVEVVEAAPDAPPHAWLRDRAFLEEYEARAAAAGGGA
ncbi:hypothetical protein ACIBF1_04595 [Spirillospora sp. NPDC050679]